MREINSTVTGQKERDLDSTQSIPYRPLPPICTVPVEQRVIVAPTPAKSERKPLTGDQLVNWRKAFPLAMFLSDAEINQFRDELQKEVDRK